MIKTKTKGAGGKLSRSEIIQARLSPRVRFVAELMARKEKRSLSSMIEILIENASKDFELPVPGNDPQNTNEYLYVKADFIVKQLWSPDEALRFTRLAFTFPQLLNAEEELRWTYIQETPYFWRCYKMILVDKNGNEISSQWKPHHSLETLVIENLREFWDILKKDKVEYTKLPSKEIAGGFISVKGESKENVAAINVKLDVDLSPLNQTEQQKWLSNYINFANKPENKNLASNLEFAKKMMTKFVDDIIEERKCVS